MPVPNHIPHEPDDTIILLVEDMRVKILIMLKVIGNLDKRTDIDLTTKVMLLRLHSAVSSLDDAYSLLSRAFLGHSLTASEIYDDFPEYHTPASDALTIIREVCFTLLRTVQLIKVMGNSSHTLLPVDTFTHFSKCLHELIALR